MQSGVVIKVRRIACSAAMPTHHETSGHGAAYVRACLTRDILLAPGAVTYVSTGLFFEVPEGYETVFSSAEPYLRVIATDETKSHLDILLKNESAEIQRISHGDLIAKFKVVPIPKMIFEEMEAV